MKKNSKFIKKEKWNFWKKLEIHSKNVKFMNKTWNHEKKRETDEKNAQLTKKKTWNSGKKMKRMEKSGKFMGNNVNFMKSAKYFF